MLPESLQNEGSVAAIEQSHPGAVRHGYVDGNALVLDLDDTHLVAICTLLRDQHQVNRLSAISGVDWYPSEPRFEIVYHLHSIARNSRFRLKVRLSEGASLPSVVQVWGSANWHEREIFDLFGVPFEGHPDLRRILLPDDWSGHPLRKDYPVHGFKYSYGEK